MDMLDFPPPITTVELSPSDVIPLKDPLTAFRPMAILFSADEAERAASPRATESLPFAFALTPMATASLPAAAASSPVELARKYFIPGFVLSNPKAEFTFFSSVISAVLLLIFPVLVVIAFLFAVISVLFCWISLAFWLIPALLLAISVLLSAILSVLAAIAVWLFCTSVLTASTSALIATPSVDIVIVFVVSSLVTETLVPAFKISPS